MAFVTVEVKKNPTVRQAQSTQGTECQGRRGEKAVYRRIWSHTQRGHTIRSPVERSAAGRAMHTLAANHVKEQNKHGEPGRGRGQRRSSPTGPDYKAPGSCTQPANSLRGRSRRSPARGHSPARRGWSDSPPGWPRSPPSWPLQS